jgi:hypothetical protein
MICDGAPSIADSVVGGGSLVTQSHRRGNRGLKMVTEQSASKLPEMNWANSEVPVVAAVAQLVCAMRRERWPLLCSI